MPLRTSGGLPITPIPRASLEKILPVKLFIQEQDNWCWAATADMVLDYFSDHDPDQCDLANQRLGRADCCADPTRPECDKGINTASVRRLYTDRNKNATLQSRAVSFAKLKEEIDADRPVLIGYEWDTGGKHLAVVRGYSQDEENDLLLVNDPYQDFQLVEVDYESLKNAYNFGTWIKTWTNLG